jgi:hypothetical protein
MVDELVNGDFEFMDSNAFYRSFWNCPDSYDELYGH